ncbi:hypothetical protein QUF74_04325 [Candidatus Halobeggiatoa sp. HSG11]|nr:hypothetical protein [Candidatus Halobeggiatoa sp. HSG11]
MQITINVPDNLSPKQLQQYIKNTEENFNKEAEFTKTAENMESNDSWIEFLENIEQYAVETGIKDFAKNHDHYLYGIDK